MFNSRKYDGTGKKKGLNGNESKRGEDVQVRGKRGHCGAEALLYDPKELQLSKKRPGAVSTDRLQWHEP